MIQSFNTDDGELCLRRLREGLASADRTLLRSALLALLNAVTQDSGRVFSSPVAAAVYAFDRFAPSVSLQRCIRRFLLRPESISPKRAAAAIGQLLTEWTELPLPADFPAFIDTVDPALEKTPEPVQLIVDRVAEILPGKQCDLYGTDSDGLSRIWHCLDHSVRTDNPDELHAGKMFHRLGKLLYKGSKLNAYGLVTNADNSLSTTPDSLLVLEPDFLVNITDLAECFYFNSGKQRLEGSVRGYLLKLLSMSETSLSLIRGSLVNEVFDFVLRNGVAPEAREIEQMLSGNLAVAGIEESRLRELLDEIRTTFLPPILAFAATLSGRPVLLEPTFIAPEYGLQGRLDALIEDAGDPLRKDIVELKSGTSPEGSQVWGNHRLQVTGYNLLLRATYSSERRGNSAIFYPAAGQNPVRNVYVPVALEQRLLALRNEIVSLLFASAGGKLDWLDRLNPGSSSGLPKFTLARLDEFSRTMAGIRPLERQWLEVFIAMTMREMIFAKIGTPNGEATGFSALWQDAAEPAGFDRMRGLTLLHAENNRAEFSYPTNCVSNFREGDIVTLYPDNGDPLHGHPLLKGALEAMTGERMTIRFWGIPGHQLTHAERWVIGHDLFDRNFVIQLQSLFRCLQADPVRRELILGLCPPQRVAPVEIELPGLSEVQAEIVRRALVAPDLFLIQGPPGTGKTSLVLNQLVRHYFADCPGETIFVLAFTNRAVDEAAAKLDDLPYLRLGREGEHSLYFHAKTDSLSSLRERVLSTRIYLGTVFSFLQQFETLQGLVTFDHVVVDEASQLLEPQLAGILATFRQVVLIGDHLQLPPVTIQSDPGTIPPELAAVGYQDLRESLFERLFRRYRTQNWSWAMATLEEHYRMHATIADCINTNYEGRLRTVLERQNGGNCPSLPGLPDGIRALFLPSAPELGEYACHRQEAMRVAKLLEACREAFPETPGAVGVITPFRAQISLIRSRLRDEPWFRDVTIDTVERFQGSERDVIIFSAAVGHNAQLRRMQSLSGTVDRKLNVVVSRARERLIVLGDPRILRQSPQYRALLDKLFFLDLSAAPETPLHLL